MSHYLKNKIWLVGTGQIGLEYAKVLQALKVPFVAIGRGSKSAQKFSKITKSDVIEGGLSQWLKKEPPIPQAVIVAVNIEELAKATMELINYGVKKILVEKPAGITLSEITKVSKLAQKSHSQVFVAYNRHFFASVLAAREIIQNDGGVTSFNFEFTEWLHQIQDLKLSRKVKANWLMANSHPIDLAFYLGGRPKKISCYSGKGEKWSFKAIYAGAGESITGALFSYQANWESPGRWGVEVLTSKHRLIFRPLEQLQIQKLGSLKSEFFKIDDRLDQQFKPGFYRQTQTFLNHPASQMLALEEHLANFIYYEKMNGKK